MDILSLPHIILKMAPSLTPLASSTETRKRKPSEELASVNGKRGKRSSARNVIRGRVVAVTPGAVNAEVIIEIAPGVQVVSIITRNSVESLGLAVGKEAYAVVKASNVMIAVD